LPDIQGTTQDGIRYYTYASPSFTMLCFNMAQGQMVTAEPGAMMFMHRTIEIETKGRGGIMKGLKVMALGGETFFVNHFRAIHGHGDLALIAPLIGDIRPLELHGNNNYIIQSGSYLANCQGVDIDTKWQGLRGFLAERDIVMLHASGRGTMFISCFGSLLERELQPGEVLTVDTGHLVAYPDTIPFQIRRVGNWKSTILSGEGLVIDLTGPGKIFLQTRHLGAFVDRMRPFLTQQ